MLIHDIVAAIGERRDYVTVFFQEMQWLDKWLPVEQFEEIDALQAEFRNYVIGVIERGIKAKLFRPVDAAVATFGLIGMVGWTYQWYTPGGRRSLEDVADIFSDMVLAALAPDEPRRAGGTKPRAAPKAKAGSRR
jgi:hypothetical protein